ncbi:MAG: diaminopimelate decarboxylase [Saprospirales bacterium]|nr:MAG: diaminopimelate decarboxylase [Saprospirales bacterium]
MELRAGKYFIDGLEVQHLAKKYGTPVYIYSAAAIIERYHHVKRCLGGDSIKLMYACKALTNPVILKLFQSLGAGLDAVSVEEMELGLGAGFLPDDIIFTPSMVGDEDYDRAVEAGVRINVGDLPALEYMNARYPNYPVCVRINPHVLAGGHQKISVGHKDSKFGISIHQMHEVLNMINARNCKVEGLHMHVGSDIQADEQFLYALEVLFKTAENFKDLTYVDIGSGYKISYKADDSSSDLEKIGSFLKEKRRGLESILGRKIELLTEPGKILVSESGFFLCSVNTVKRSPTRTFVGVNTGFNHLIRPMLYDAWHEIVNVSNPDGEKEKVDVVGYICETDTFASNREINLTSKGDLLVFKNAGAYGFNMGSNYNSKFRPPEVLIFEGKDYLIRRREEMKDLIKSVVDPMLF